MSRPKDLIPEALRRVRIHQAASQIGLCLPEAPGACKSPFREERNPSFSWFIGRDGKDRWKDFGTGEGGDTIDFIRKALGCSFQDATKELLRLADLCPSDAPKRKPPALLTPPKPSKPTAPKKAAKDLLPSDLHAGSPGELSELIESRGWIASPEDLQEPTETGTLRIGTFFGHRSWLLVDDRLRFFEARRLDAKLWENGAKSNSRGSKSLLGAERLYPGCVCLFVEGAPDYLSAFILKARAKDESCANGSDCFPVAALGASSSVSPEDLARFRGVRVLMFPHRDNAGQEACAKWKRDLKRGGATVQEVNLEPYLIRGGKDLADCVNTQRFVELARHCGARADLMRREKE